VLFVCIIYAVLSSGVCNGDLSCAELQSPVKLIGSKSYLDLGNNRTVLFPWNGLGYSPTPNSDSLANAPFGDYFQASSAPLWEDRDIQLMINMNASVVRVWSWNFISDHKQFMDDLWSLSGCR
jgi:hypothetical protein